MPPNNTKALEETEQTMKMAWACLAHCHQNCAAVRSVTQQTKEVTKESRSLLLVLDTHLKTFNRIWQED